jgi:hypothetical protein
LAFRIARENLGAITGRPKVGELAPTCSWSKYCVDISINKNTAKRWQNKWFPERLDLENKPADFSP